MKIIFLDIDGVIKEDKQGAPFIPESLRALKSVIDKTGAKIVMSSSWKVKYKAFVDNGFKTDIADILSLFAALSENGLSVYDYTPVSNAEKPLRRPAEIREYLDRAENVEAFCIFDDRAEFRWAELSQNLVLTLVEGAEAHLTEKHAAEALKILTAV